MIDNLIFKDEVKSFLKNELRQNKEAGTYLFYGDHGIDLFGLALAFTMGLNCPELENDYCDVCEVCKKIKHRNYADLEIVELAEGESKVKIDKVKDVIYQASNSSYEGRKKVFIIKDIESMNIYSSNALLKIMEEPPEGTYFILISNTLNILPTILSRSIVLKVPKSSSKELGVNDDVYNFFLGNAEDILEWKKTRDDLEGVKSYSSLGEYFHRYLENRDLESKIELYRGVEDYIYNLYSIKKLDKMKIISDILSVLQDDKLVSNKSHERKIVGDLMHLFIIKLKKPEKTEKLIELKQGLRSNTNTQINLTLFFLNF